MSSTFASCSLSPLSKVISGISSSGASLSMCWFQTPAQHCRFSSFIWFMGVQTGDEAGGHLEKKTLHSGFPLLFCFLFSLLSATFTVLSPSEPCSCCSLFCSNPLSPLSNCISLFAQRVAWEPKTSSAGAASSCSRCRSFYHFLWRSHSYQHSYILKYKRFSDACLKSLLLNFYSGSSMSVSVSRTHARNLWMYRHIHHWHEFYLEITLLNLYSSNIKSQKLCCIIPSIILSYFSQHVLLHLFAFVLYVCVWTASTVSRLSHTNDSQYSTIYWLCRCNAVSFCRYILHLCT